MWLDFAALCWCFSCSVSQFASARCSGVRRPSDGDIVNPLRGQNNVQGSCDMGSFPHEFPGYRHVSDDSVRALFEEAWDTKLQGEPGLRIPNMFEAALDGEFKGLYIEGEDIAQSDPNTQHVTVALTSMECIIVQDLFLNESAKFAHVFLPGLRFPLILTTGRILSQYNVGAQTRRTENNQWHDEDRLEIHPQDAEDRGIVEGDWVGIESRAGDTVLRARVTERVQPGVVYSEQAGVEVSEMGR
jgi:predicted molibdopterin-dependent oxidoreductase YjgC